MERGRDRRRARSRGCRAAHCLAGGPRRPTGLLLVPTGRRVAFWPFAQLSLSVSFFVQGALMIACIAAAGLIAARVYGLTPELAILAALAWAPTTASVVLGQNVPFALLLAMVAIWALATDRPWLAGLAVGLLWYKPTLALGFVVLFAIRGRWRELGVALAAAGVAFLLPVAAAGGDWNWLATWLDGARAWLPADAASNADKAISLPGLLGRLPVPWVVPVLGGAALALAAVPGLRRAGIVEAASAACLVGLAAGPRTWGYEAALAFPLICWALGGGVKEPWRTRLLVVAYLLGPLWFFSSVTQLSAIAVVVLTASVLWCRRWWRPGTGVFANLGAAQNS